ncbi:hypothetical protein B0H16DRAFT_1445933 [Mycena metata]|uniref:Uncharacterized protein n=1 Tax=Mycena metata TaxID=1033252 RepID=A0AAD7KJ64_9AGAR|nr:hypothetical protein B0H16DRAFT_1445933 [Mycena metata]
MIFEFPILRELLHKGEGTFDAFTHQCATRRYKTSSTRNSLIILREILREGLASILREVYAESLETNDPNGSKALVSRVTEGIFESAKEVTKSLKMSRKIKISPHNTLWLKKTAPLTRVLNQSSITSNNCFRVLVSWLSATLLGEYWNNQAEIGVSSSVLTLCQQASLSHIFELFFPVTVTAAEN